MIALFDCADGKSLSFDVSILQFSKFRLAAKQENILWERHMANQAMHHKFPDYFPTIEG